MADIIPVVDFSELGKGSIISNQPSDLVNRLAKEMYDIFSTTGFLYIKNHSIDQGKISNLFQIADTFFRLPPETKALSARRKIGVNHGWVGCEVESLDPANPGDFKEGFNVEELYNDSLPWPTVGCDTFKATVQDFFQECEDLTVRVLDLIAIGLGLEDQSFLRRIHQNMSSATNGTALRLLHYPAITQQMKEGQLRCGKHSDYGSITFLFQDNVGGLEVCKPNGQFVAARPIEGTIVVNLGDLMQRWTNNKLVSTPHRVVMPKEESFRSKVRHSAAFFVNPNNDAVIECLDGSNSYPPITALDYLKQRLAVTYI